MATKAIEAMVLGALFEGPLSAYEMDRLLERRGVRQWARISRASVYRTLLGMAERGLVAGEARRDSAGPEKVSYRLTEEGVARFDEAMEELACEAATIDFGFMAVVANLGAVEEEAGRWMLEVLAEGCERRAEAVEGAAASAESIEAREALGLYGRAFRLTSSWLRRLRRTYYRNQRKLQRRAQRVRRDGARGL